MRLRGTNDYSTAEFRRVIDVMQKVVDEETGREENVKRRAVRIVTEGTGKAVVTLVPMKSLSLEDYDFPFQNTAKIRDALRLQVMPFTAAGELEIFPVMLSKSGRGSSGIVWYVSPEELDMPSGDAGKIWPSPLPLISELEDYGGNGVTMWIDEENVSSILWQSRRPVMYRWKKYSQDAESRELSFYDAYSATRELERGGNFVMNAANGDYSGEDFSEIVSESVKICPWISDVNLSRTVLEGARDLERTLKLLTKVSIWLIVILSVVLGAELLNFLHVDDEVQKVRTRSEKYYRETFDPTRTGRIANPVNLARDRIASLTGKSEEGHPLDEVLADLGEVFGQVSGITIDTIRYNADGIDCVGVAPDMTTALNFRKAWEDKANLVQVDNTQFVSGIGYRFDLRVRW
ncbi:MAG: hypothetical protein IJM68_08590 [Synergistaceae bacterium]|nr:hypothetical protein [Synergistaceae bacterium]